MSKVRFTAFADLHHHPAWFKTDSIERLSKIQERAEESNSEFLIQLGDLCHQISTAQELIDRYNNGRVKGFHVLGNHEFDLNKWQDIVKAYNMPDNYYSFDQSGFRFVILDENYFCEFGNYFHYSERNYFDHPNVRDYLNPEQIEWFRETVLSSPYPCVVFSHDTLEYKGIRNQEEIHNIIRQSQSLPGRVIMCINGHYHRDSFNVIDNVAYLDLNSASSDWIPNPHHFFPEEWYREYEEVGNQIIYKEPLSAVITLDTDGTIDIQGVMSEFVCGVSREMTDNRPARRPCTPNILNRHIAIP